MKKSNTNRLRSGNGCKYNADGPVIRNQTNMKQKKFANLPKRSLDASNITRHTYFRGNNRGTFSIKEAANYLGISRSTLYSLIYANEIISIKIRGRRLITRDEIIRFLDMAQSEAMEQARKGVLYAQ